MAESLDVLFINPGDRKQIYQGLGDEFSAIEPPVFAGLFATFLRQKGHSVCIYDAPAMTASADEVARIAEKHPFLAKLLFASWEFPQFIAMCRDYANAHEDDEVRSDSKNDGKVLQQ